MPRRHMVRKGIQWLLSSVAARIAPQRVKRAAEMRYWRERWEAEGQAFENTHYRTLMLGMAGEQDASFVEGKVVADFGCGPRGSLCWATEATTRIGIDVLADAYAEFNVAAQNMRYVCSTEKAVPLPSDSIDILFTVNAMDHVVHFEVMCRDIVRILAPGGQFIGSFNLDEPRTPAEPQTLTEDRVKHCLLDQLEVTSYRTATRGPDGNAYQNCFDGTPAPSSGPRFLWVRATKPPAR